MVNTIFFRWRPSLCVAVTSNMLRDLSMMIRQNILWTFPMGTSLQAFSDKVGHNRLLTISRNHLSYLEHSTTLAT